MPKTNITALQYAEEYNIYVPGRAMVAVVHHWISFLLLLFRLLLFSNGLEIVIGRDRRCKKRRLVVNKVYCFVDDVAVGFVDQLNRWNLSYYGVIFYGLP